MAPRAKKPRISKDIDIDSLYEQCQSSDASIYQLEESGITSKIWNIFVSQDNDEPKKVASSSYLEKAAFILLRMINVRTVNLPSSEMNGPLAIMDDRDAFESFLTLVLKLPERDYVHIVHFLITAFSNLTKEMYHSIREPLLDMVGIKLWKDMGERYRDLQLKRITAFRRRWSALQSNSVASITSEEPQFFAKLFNRFLIVLSNQEEKESRKLNKDVENTDSNASTNPDIPDSDPVNDTDIEFLAATLQLTIDLLSNPTIRRFMRPYILSKLISVRCKISKLFQRSNLFMQLVQTLQYLETFPIEDISASPLSPSDMAAKYHERAHILQKMCLRHYPDELSDFIYAGVGMICKEDFLRKNLNRIVDTNVLLDLAHRLRLVDKNEFKDKEIGRKFILTVMIDHHALRQSESMMLAQMALYPDETVLWNPHLVPFDDRSKQNAEKTLALPKLAIQFLSYGDYLLRCFKLLRMESAYEIRSDIEDAIKRMKPSIRHGYSDGSYLENEVEILNKRRNMTAFHGWSRMGLELTESDSPPVKILKVDPPKLGENIPAQVIAQVVLDLKHCGGQIRKEWDEICEHDNLFLVGVDALLIQDGPAVLTEDAQGEDKNTSDHDNVNFLKRYGVLAVRGCMVLEVRDEHGNLLSDPNYYNQNTKYEPSYKRYLKVQFDPAQYAADATGAGSPFGTKVYQTLNVVVRRHGRENNFKAVLETIKGLMQGVGSINRVVPKWIQPVLLGHGDPRSATFSSPTMRNFATMTNGVTPPDAALDYGDTFLSESHLRDSFEGCRVLVDGRDQPLATETCRVRYRVKIENEDSKAVVSATSYPFEKEVNGNSIQFTPTQVSAIRSGLSPGLSMIVGPPGTGKTDVAVQIISNLYHSFPSQRTVIITHSNAALNDLFEKVMARGDIDERYMLRLGAGERELKKDTEFDFTKIGRVNHILARRAELLEQVQLLSESLGVSGTAERGPDGSPSYTCETAEYFNLHHVKKRIEVFRERISKNKDKVGDFFPFSSYFMISPEDAAKMTIETANDKLLVLDRYFIELSEYRPLELLRSQRQRTDYLLTKQTRIVAMTCTHAAIARSHLIDVGFQYDNVVMEEAGQMMDIETFIPLLLQKGEIDSHSRLKRICLIGDHHQLPPVVKNITFSKYSNLDQSLFTRLIRLGVPTIDLDKQGRSRDEIAKLYTWRYKNLGNLEHVFTKDKFLRANTGLAFTYQMINVEDYEGRGEYSPTPYFYQNTGEAEYAVALFQYMVLIGTPPEKISILTTYNGQKDLLNDIVTMRCNEGTPLAGIRPGAISTVDQYQGQQNDYVILSLVRTKSVGHLRDIRRLIVAVSRARLGLYVLCRESLFRKCDELKHVMNQLTSRPTKLELVTGEEYPTERKTTEKIPEDKKFTVDDVTVLGSIVHNMQEQMSI
jgi:intron-binding protein aquarius